MEVAMSRGATLTAMNLVIRTAANTLAVWLTFWLIDGLDWGGDLWALLAIALILGLVNALIKPVVNLLALPIRVLTLGLFTLVINVVLMAGVIFIADALDLGVTSDGWQTTLIGGVVLSIVSAFLSMILDD
jgi:putative membrane protein